MTDPEDLLDMFDIYQQETETLILFISGNDRQE